MTQNSHEHLEWETLDFGFREHRPPTKGVYYKLVRKDREPVSDEDWELVHNCTECYPIESGKLIDRISNRSLKDA